MNRRPSRALLAAALVSAGCFAHQYRTNPRVAVIDGDPIVQMKRQTEMPAALEAPLVPAEQHSDRPEEFERVVGVAVGSEARAYPIGLLDRFEVINDRAGDLSFVVTRCALAGIAAIYDRRVGGRILSFENSGALWRDTLVFRDRETGTYWTAATGRALAGPLAGEQLSAIPAIVTRAQIWDRVYPRSLYLDLNVSTAVSLTMRLYEASSSQGVSGAKTSDRRYKPKEELFVLREGTQALALTEIGIRSHAPIVADLDGKRITIEWDEALEAPRAHVDSEPQRELTLVPMYWFALDRHFATVRTLADVVAARSAARQ